MSTFPRRPPRFVRVGASGTTQAIHPAEKMVTVLVMLWTIFQPWAFGTMHVWSQSIALALAALAFAVSLYPRLLVAEGESFRIAPWRLLVRLPLFWLVLAVFAYAAMQALNPAWGYRQSLTHWWLERQSAVSWLPHGIDAPFERGNGWRKIFVWASPFFAGLAIWLGITRRRTAYSVLIALVVNATLVGVYAIAQQAAGVRKIFWRFSFPDASGPFGSFIYKNHAAAYLLIAFVAACGLAVTFYLRGAARGARSTPAPVLGFVAVVLALGTVFSLSRLGAVLTAVAVILLAAAFGFALRRGSPGGWWIPLAAGLLLATGAGLAAAQLGTAKIGKGLERLARGGGDDSLKVRVYSYHLTLDMLNEHPWLGVGAGGFRHLAPAYAGPFPAVTQSNRFAGPLSWKSVRTYGINETHSEPLQLAAEFGVIGGTVLAAAAAFMLAAITRAAGSLQPIALASLVAHLCMSVFAMLDFPLHNPAVIAGLVVLGTIGCRLSQIESSAARS